MSRASRAPADGPGFVQHCAFFWRWRFHAKNSRILRETYISRTSLLQPCSSPNSLSKATWRDVMGIPKDAVVTRETLKTTYRKLAAQRHPDKRNGSQAAMSALNAAYDEALKEVSG